MDDTLEKIFGGVARVKIMRLFLFNPEASFLMSEIVTRSKVDAGRARREVSFLLNVGLLKKNARGGKPTWHLNEKFPYLVEFQRLLLQTSLINTQNGIIKKLSRIGRLKLVVLSGLFKDQQESRLDILVVADGAKKGVTESTMASIEAEMGKEIRYAVLDTTDFKYRLGVGDRLIRDVIDYPHEVMIDKVGFK